jgi:hypothetical protein
MRHELAWLSVVAVTFVAFFGPMTATDRFLILDDSWSWSLPLRDLAWDQIREGRIPGWTRAVLSGYPLLSMAQVGVGYPFTWGYLLDAVWGEQIYVLAPFLLSPTLMYAYARSIGRSRAASVLAGLSFGYGGAMASSITHNGMLSNGFMWLPLVLACLEHVRTRPFLPCLIVAALAYAMAILSGIGQAFLLAGLLIGAYAAFLTLFPAQNERSPWRRFRPITLGVLSVVLAAGVGAFQILETRRAHALSIRRELDFATFAQGSAPPLTALESLVAPFYASIGDVTAYVSMLTLLLGVCGLTLAPRGRARDPRMFFWLFVALVSWVLMFGANTPLFQLLHRVPIFNLFRVPARHSTEWTFAASVLGAYGWDALAGRLPRAAAGERWLRAAGVVVLLAAVVVAGFWIVTASPDGKTSYIIAKVVIAVMSIAVLLVGFATGSTAVRNALLSAVIPLACVTEPYICLSNWWFPVAKTREQLTTPSKTTELVQRVLPPNGRVYSYVEAFEEQRQSRPRFDAPNRTGWLGLDDVGGYEPLMLARYSHALGDVDLFAMARDRRPHASLGDPFNPRSRVLDILSTALVVRRVGQEDPSIPGEWSHTPALDRVILDFGGPTVQPRLQSGWSGGEILGQHSGVWSDGPRSRVAVTLLPLDAPYVLTILTGTFRPAVPLTLEVTVNDVHVGSLEIQPGWQERSLDIAKGVLVDGTNNVDFAYSRTAAPAATIPGATDMRQLALFVDQLAVTPAF